jgi:hypothetical protein
MAGTDAKRVLKHNTKFIFFKIGDHAKKSNNTRRTSPYPPMVEQIVDHEQGNVSAAKKENEGKMRSLQAVAVAVAVAEVVRQFGTELGMLLLAGVETPEEVGTSHMFLRISHPPHRVGKPLLKERTRLNSSRKGSVTATGNWTASNVN